MISALNLVTMTINAYVGSKAWNDNEIEVLRGRLLRAVCRFSDAESDFRAVLDLRPGHKAATSELQKVKDGREALAAAQTCGCLIFIILCYCII